MSEPIRSVDEYLDRLRQALSGADPALVQDATFDAAEHLRSALEGGPEDAARLAPVIDEYGAPEEVAAAYRDTDAVVAAALAAPRRRPRSRLERVFGVFVDPRAYTSLLFMLLTLPTGIAYFTWAACCVTLSIGLVPLALGLFVAGGGLLAASVAEGWIAWAMVAASSVVIWRGWLHPLAVLGLGAGAGALLF